MMLISPEYVEQNRKLHAENEAYGTSGTKWSRRVVDLGRRHRCETILDYGCGKRQLEEALVDSDWGPIDRHEYSNGGFFNYDPCIEGFEAEPKPADFVVVGDVMEHIEPECLEDVLDHIQVLTKKIVMFMVSTQDALKTLPDGRNTHLIVEPIEWWIPQFRKRFRMLEIDYYSATEFTVIGGAFDYDPETSRRAA